MIWTKAGGINNAWYTLWHRAGGRALGYVGKIEQGYRARPFGQKLHFDGTLDTCKAWLEAVCALGDEE